MLRWENLQTSSFTGDRAKVPGGWFVRIDGPGGIGIAFYPDPNHEWDGTSVP